MNPALPASWSLWRRLSFRFIFLYAVLAFNPLQYLAIVPGLQVVAEWLLQPLQWLTEWFNRTVLHIANPLVMPAGSGDTSFVWASTVLYLLIAIVGTVIWSAVAYKKTHHTILSYWFFLGIRYLLSMTCFSYGVLKLFALQMPFPNMSQLATPLGDFLPMRLSWMFLGYGQSYQVFSGVAEVLAGLLLFWRRTATLGTLMAIGVFANVAMLNLTYDIPVKLFSIHCVLQALLLAWQDRQRLLAFFIQNKTALPSQVYQPYFTNKRMRIARIVLKTVFILLGVMLPALPVLEYIKEDRADYTNVLPPVKPGVYHPALTVKNGDTLTFNPTDDQQWKDFIFDYNGNGSIQSTDTLLRQRYRRGYFIYEPDSTGNRIRFYRFRGDELPLFTLQLQQPDSNTMLLSGRIRADSMFWILKRVPRHFQLAEKQFHWLSEANR